MLQHIQELILYGSRVRGDAADDSDLDLVALVDEKTPELKIALDEIAYSVMWDRDFKPMISLKVFSESVSVLLPRRVFHFIEMSFEKAL